jgi:hypothetical protein
MGASRHRFSMYFNLDPHRHLRSVEGRVKPCESCFDIPKWMSSVRVTDTNPLVQYLLLYGCGTEQLELLLNRVVIQYKLNKAKI